MRDIPCNELKRVFAEKDEGNGSKIQRDSLVGVVYQNPTLDFRISGGGGGTLRTISILFFL